MAFDPGPDFDFDWLPQRIGGGAVLSRLPPVVGGCRSLLLFGVGVGIGIGVDFSRPALTMVLMHSIPPLAEFREHLSSFS
jgi:hypothetical protein